MSAMMTAAEFEECIERVLDVLPEEVLDAMSVLGAACNTVVGQAEKLRPGVAMTWMDMLQRVFDEDGVRT